jgi:hypothetical protein
VFEPHEGAIQLEHTFQQAYAWLGQGGPAGLQTNRGTRFEARASEASKGVHHGEQVIRFIQDSREFGRAYECCWGHYYNCNRTRIGMYCAALDAAVGHRNAI